MTGHADMLGLRQHRAIEALLAGLSREAAAAVAGVSDRTLRRWARREDFALALRGAQARAFDEALGLLRASALDGVRALREVATDRGTPPPARVAAARALIEEGRKAVELDDLAERLSAIEAALAAGQEGRQWRT